MDFWSEAKDKDGKPRHGTIKVTKVGKPKQVAKNHVSVETQNEWITPDGVKIMDEMRIIHFTRHARRPAVHLRHHAEGERLPDHVRRHEGGLVRHPRRTTRCGRASQPAATVTTADGKSVTPPAKDNLPIWGYPAAWIDYCGKVDGKAVGIAVFDHPKNPHGELARPRLRAERRQPVRPRRTAASRRRRARQTC